jgi:hypothetical protein
MGKLVADTIKIRQTFHQYSKISTISRGLFSLSEEGNTSIAIDKINLLEKLSTNQSIMNLVLKLINRSVIDYSGMW